MLGKCVAMFAGNSNAIKLSLHSLNLPPLKRDLKRTLLICPGANAKLCTAYTVSLIDAIVKPPLECGLGCLV